jgi:hypothetical protein
MSSRKTFITGKTVDGSNNLTVLASEFPTLSMHVTATSSLAGVFEGTMDDLEDGSITVDWFPIPAIYMNTSGVTENAPGATITPTDDDTLHACLTGCRYGRFRRTVGSGTVSYCLNPDTVEEIRSAAGDDLEVTVTHPDAIIGPGDPVIDSYTFKAINLTTGADQVLASSAADKQIWVYGFGFTVGDAAGQTVSFQDEDDTALSGIMEFIQYGGMAVPPSGNFAMPIWKLATNKDLEVDITGGDVDGWLTYAVISVA